MINKSGPNMDPCGTPVDNCIASSPTGYYGTAFPICTWQVTCLVSLGVEHVWQIHVNACSTHVIHVWDIHLYYTFLHM